VKFIDQNFLLHSKTARLLYRNYAEQEPIFDYHCHLSPQDIAENRRFNNLSELWLEGDHYKWRAMRANGVSERYCTGDAEPFEKFRAWAGTVPNALRNPLYHWTHLELKRYFGIDELLNQNSAGRIWTKANSRLAAGQMTTHAILKRFNVRTVCTTDDPADDLRHHQLVRASGLATRVLPCFRPDKALAIDQPGHFNPWLHRLEQITNLEIRNLDSFLEVLRRRHAAFHAVGCRLSDHCLKHCYAEFCSEKTAGQIFAKARRSRVISPSEQNQFASFMMLFFGRLDAEKGWVKQLHLGALRNNNTRLLTQLGPDTGFDSIGDFPQASALAAYLDRLDRDNALPKTILYNVNPTDNCVFAALIGNFQD